MKPIFYYFCICIMLLTPQLFAQTISGTVTDTNGQALPFVSIYSKENLKSTISNPEGKYTIKLAKGSHVLIFKYMGMETLEKEVQVNHQDIVLNVQLKESAILLEEVEVKGKEEDPAYGIMRKAIGFRTYYQKQVLSYQGKGYSKMNFEIHKIPRMMVSMLGSQLGDLKDSIDIFLNKPMVMESFMDLNYTQKDGLSYHILSNRTNVPFTDSLESGIPIYMISLYDQKSFDVLSPLAPNAFSYYKFEYLGMFEDQGAWVNKIKVTPRKGGMQLYTGTIYINENIWNIHSAELSFKYPMGTINVTQTYAPTQGKIWMPVTFDQRGDTKIMGAKMSFRYVTSIQDYSIQENKKLRKPNLGNSLEDTIAVSSEDSIATPKTKRQEKLLALEQKDDLNNREMRKLYRLTQKEVKEKSPKKDLRVRYDYEMMTYDSLAHKRDSSYWEENRLVPLTASEIENETFFDSIKVVIEGEQSKKKTADSLANAAPKSIFTQSLNTSTQVLGKVLLSGQTLYKSDKKKKWLYMDGLLWGSSINNVDGYNIGTSLKYNTVTKGKENRQNYFGKISYTERRDRVLFELGMKNQYAPKHRGLYEISLGSTSKDYNNYNGFSPILNTIVGILGDPTPLRLYQEDYVSVGNRIDVIHGLVFSANLKYANRTYLDSYSETYTNKIDNIESTSSDIPFEEHRAFISDFRLEYTPQQYYHILKTGRKRLLNSKYPSFYLGHRKGWNQVSDIDFDLVYGGFKGSSPLNFRSDLKYYTKAGKFYNTSDMTFIDYQHFNNNPIAFSTGYDASQFFFPELYEQSTNDEFLEAGLALQSSRLLLKRLPILKDRMMLQERVFAHYLYTPTLGHYVEYGYGLSGIFGIIDLDVVSNFKDNKVEGFKVIFGLNIFGN